MFNNFPWLLTASKSSQIQVPIFFLLNPTTFWNWNCIYSFRYSGTLSNGKPYRAEILEFDIWKMTLIHPPTHIYILFSEFRGTCWCSFVGGGGGAKTVVFMFRCWETASNLNSSHYKHWYQESLLYNICISVFPFSTARQGFYSTPAGRRNYHQTHQNMSFQSFGPM